MGMSPLILAALPPGHHETPERTAATIAAFGGVFAPTATLRISPAGWYDGEGDKLEGHQLFEIETGIRYFSPGYTRGDWPLTEQWLRWLLSYVSPEVYYGASEYDGPGNLVDEALLAEHRALWDAMPIEDQT